MSGRHADVRPRRSRSVISGQTELKMRSRPIHLAGMADGIIHVHSTIFTELTTSNGNITWTIPTRVLHSGAYHHAYILLLGSCIHAAGFTESLCHMHTSAHGIFIT